jgi:hypothetical protein
MRLRAGLGLLCVGLVCGALAGCQHVPEGVKIDLHNRVVEVGPCRCRLLGSEKPVEPVPPVAEEPPAAEAKGDGLR